MHVAVKRAIYTFMLKHVWLFLSLPFMAYPCSTTKAASLQAEDVFVLNTVETLTIWL